MSALAPWAAVCCTALGLLVWSGAAADPLGERLHQPDRRRTGPAVTREAQEAFKRGEYDRVVRLLESATEPSPPRELLQVGFQSYLRLGRAEAALKLYHQLVPPGRPDQLPWLRQLALAFITGHARDASEFVRVAAYTALAEVAGREAVPLLEDGLLDPSVMVRARAVEGLGRTGPAGVAGVKRALKDPATAVRVAALHALGGEGHRAGQDATLVEALTEIARREEGPPSVFALAVLVRWGREQALNGLLSAATLPDPETRMAALGVLGKLKRPATLSLLTQAVYDPDPSVRAFAAGALGEFGSPEGASALTHLLSDESPRVRSVAAASLGRLRVASLRPLLWQAARDPVELVRTGAVEGLLRQGDQEILLVAQELTKHPDPSVRSAVGQALGIPGQKRAIALLEALLRDQQPQPRLAAARALGRIGRPEVVPVLKHALQDTDVVVRIAAAGSLAQVLAEGK
ncbi:HEAT repeat domain-containing protein [Nitrospira sp. Kam-Ns4a]